MDFSFDQVVYFVVTFGVAVPAIVFHEVAHGYAAYLLGDPTAKNAGRLSLNPLRHVDPFGTVLLPLLLLAMGSPAVFGYAKPVPVNPAYFEDHRHGMLLTGIAGPGANLVMAALSGIGFRLVSTLLSGVGYLGGTGEFVVGVLLLALVQSCTINLVLLFFNLIPIPGLDGSRLIERFLPPEGLRVFRQLGRYTMLLVFGLLWLAPGLIGAYFGLTVDPLFSLFTGLSG